MCLSRKPWLIVMEFMEYKDLGMVLRSNKKSNVKLQVNELLNFAVQVAHACKYITDVMMLISTRIV